MKHVIEKKGDELYITIVVTSERDDLLVRRLFALHRMPEVTEGYFEVTGDYVGILELARFLSDLDKWDWKADDGVASRDLYTSRVHEAIRLAKAAPLAGLTDEQREMRSLGMHMPVETKIEMARRMVEKDIRDPARKKQALKLLDMAEQAAKRLRDMEAPGDSKHTH